VLVWTFVIAPRRARARLDEYRARGYDEIDVRAPDLVAALEALTPVMPEGSLNFGEGRRQPLNAMVGRSALHTRYVVNMAETWDDQADAGTVWRTLFFERRPLEIDSEFSARLSANNIGQGREERLGFQPVRADGASPDFAAAFSVFSRDGRPVRLSGSLQEALREAGRALGQASRFNTRFTREGWSIAVSNAYLQRKALRVFVDTAERISAAL
jgi:hypothetical protein